MVHLASMFSRRSLLYVFSEQNKNNIEINRNLCYCVNIPGFSSSLYRKRQGEPYNNFANLAFSGPTLKFPLAVYRYRRNILHVCT